MKSPSPTLVVFTLGAAAESARRRLLPEGLRGVEAGVRHGCLEAALEAGRSSGCDLAVCSPAPLELGEGVRYLPQSEGDFGSRLERALLDAAGTGPLLVVGSDVPGLASRHLEAALASLDEDPERVVLGPSPDGGFYLIALARPLPGLRDATRWCRRDTLRRLIAWLQALGRPVVLLEPLADLDRPADLDRWLARRPAIDGLWRGLVRLLAEALSAWRRPLVPRRPAKPRPALSGALAGRAPPALLLP